MTYEFADGAVTLTDWDRMNGSDGSPDAEQISYCGKLFYVERPNAYEDSLRIAYYAAGYDPFALRGIEYQAVFGGSAVVLSLRSGLDSLEARLGADIIVLPIEAESKKSLENLLLQGTVGAFYMDSSALERVWAVEGVEAAAPRISSAQIAAITASRWASGSVRALSSSGTRRPPKNWSRIG